MERQRDFALHHRRFNIYKICQVCLAPARKDVNLFHHYGAVCCLSCKAFFRRYVRGENNLTTFKCKTGGRCDITGSRTSCKKCRFMKCLHVGMDPSKVLNEEERKKYSQKRIRLDQQSNNSDGGQSSENEPSSNQSNSSPEHSVKMADTPSPIPFIPPGPPTPPIVHPLAKIAMHQNLPQVRRDSVNSAESAYKSAYQAMPAKMSSSPTPSPKPADLAALVQSAQTTFFQEVYNEFSYDPRLANRVLAGHLDISNWNGGHSAAFLNIMETVVPFMHLAAMKSPQFRELCSHDQRLLLKNNSILLREYLTARYLIAETGTEQLVWAFGPSDSIRLGVEDVYRLSRVDFKLVNQEEGYLISTMNPSAIKSYKMCLEVIQKHFHYPPFYTPLIANFFLFSTSSWAEEDVFELNDLNKVKELETEARQMILFGSERITVGLSYLNQLTKTLMQMASLKEFKLCNFSMQDENRYCAMAEVLWINKKMNLWFGSISLDTKPDSVTVERIIAHHLGADHLRHQVLFDLFAIEAKRYLQLLASGFGIENPSIPEVNMNLCNMLIGIKADQAGTVMDCIRIYTGVQDLGHFEDLYGSMVNRPKIDNDHFCILIGAQNLNAARRAHFAVGQFIQRKDIFFLTLLNFLFLNCDEYSHWSKSIKRLLMKRLNDYQVIKGLCDVEVIFDRFCNDFAVFINLTKGIIQEGTSRPPGIEFNETTTSTNTPEIQEQQEAMQI